MKTASAVLAPVDALSASPGCRAEHAAASIAHQPIELAASSIEGRLHQHGHGRVIRSGCGESGPELAAQRDFKPSGRFIQNQQVRGQWIRAAAQPEVFCSSPPEGGRRAGTEGPEPGALPAGSAAAAAASARAQAKQAPRKKSDVLVDRLSVRRRVFPGWGHVGERRHTWRRLRGLHVAARTRTALLAPGGFRPPGANRLDFPHSIRAYRPLSSPLATSR